MVCDVAVRYRIYAGGINNPLRGQSCIRLIEGVILEKINHSGIRSAAGSGVREVASEHVRSKRRNLVGCAPGLPLSLVADEPEDLVFHEGAARGKPKLVAAQEVFRKPVFVVEIRVGRKSAVAIELEGRTMDLVGPGLLNNADDPAGVASVFGSVVAGENTEFLNGIRIGSEDYAITEQIVVHAAIQKKSDRIGA